MALPTAPSFWSGRSRALEQQLVRHREQEARFRRQWELNSLYFKQSGVYSSKQAQWSSRQSYEQSMNAYRREKLKEEKRISLERRRRQLQALLFEEREMLATELQALRLNKDTDLSKMRQKTEDLKSAREEQRKQIAEDRLYECWKKNSAKLREREAAEREEESRTENEYEAARREALERLKEQEERRRQDRQRQAELLRQQVEELQLREAEAAKLKKEEENLLRQHWELEALEGERRRQEQNRKKIELGRFLKQQWHAQLKRRAQQIQADLEKDRQILQALAEEEDEEQRLQSARRERAVAAVAWMKEVIEEQLRLEREREAELETVFREEAKQVWERREQQWAREQEARDRLMAEVLAERARQIQEKVQLNRRAQEESVQCREQLIQGLEEAKRLLRLEKEGETVLKTARRRELEAQLTERRLREQEERERQRQEEAEARLEEQRHEALEQLEARRMAEHGYRSKPHSCPKTAWA
ncbi:trichoplein keratin filament-binding protein isoform X2 [Varanus komodoensis]|uniref:trichoplein keratin filament-binding protein isoform X2 n=1 Tax=Varanus komodoensis TaxID=61221 RepID=UPI001CF794FA|nr:trichoplein keratin filament-binding protein isoform X2 [Varanus komodoensis]